MSKSFAKSLEIKIKKLRKRYKKFLNVAEPDGMCLKISNSGILSYRVRLCLKKNKEMKDKK